MGARTWRCTASLCLEWCPAFNAFSTSWVYSPYWADEKQPVLQFRALIRMWQSSPRLQCTLSLTQRWMISTIFNLSWCWWVQSWCRFAVRCVTWQWICIELYRWLMIAVFCWGTFGFFSFGFDTSMPHFHSMLSSFFFLLTSLAIGFLLNTWKSSRSERVEFWGCLSYNAFGDSLFEMDDESDPIYPRGVPMKGCWAPRVQGEGQIIWCFTEVCSQRRNS